MLTDETVLARTASVGSTSTAFSLPCTAVGEKPALHSPRLVL